MFGGIFMNKKCLLFPLLLVFLVLSGCQNKTQNKDNSTISSEGVSTSDTSSSERKNTDYDEKEVNSTIEPLMSTSTGSISIPVTYKRQSFLNDSNKFDKDLALLSYGLCATSGRRLNTKTLYESLDFDEVYNSPSYMQEPTEETVAYFFAHRKIADFDLISVTLRSYNYYSEWANNFDLGLEGDHQGFKKSAEIVLADLNTYLVKQGANEKTKLWITGYSRGGAISNVLAHNILKDDSFVVKHENVYIYTFEAPRALTLENAVKYPNVHNIFNSGDFIADIAPKEYGLYRSGNEIDTYSDKVDEYLKELDKELVLPELNTESTVYENDIEHKEYVIQTMLSVKEVEEGKYDPYISTREDFVNKYQRPIMDAISLYYHLSGTTKAKIEEDLNAMNPMAKMLIINTKDGLYNFLSPYVIEDEYDFDDAKLQAMCERLYYFISGPGSTLLSELLISANNGKRMIYLHTMEVNYVLLKNYEVK